MNAENILGALGDVSDAWITDAEAPVRRRRPVRWMAVLAAVLVLTVALAATAAAYTDAGHAILYALSPAVAQALKPVNGSCEKNGVRMTVDSAVIENNTAYIRIDMTDLEGDLFDGSVDLYDSYSVDRAFDCVGHCTKEGYDEATHTVTYLIQLAPMDDTILKPGKVTFRVGELRGHAEQWEQVIDNVDLTCADPAPETLSNADLKTLYGWQGVPLEQDCLAPGEPTEICPGAAVTGLGWVDGKLRVQIREQLSAELNTTGFVWLADEDDARLDTDYEIFFDQANQFRYDNYDFDITPEEAGSFKLAGFFHILRDPIDGPWEVTFKLQ